ncbi:MAG TPA: prepilin-type N-terminal cleavage/methylation domain-containing protein [Candidatus Rifleibacterium sp.]|nr:prepilin-type N-terminal cleavage/methylation domain-containing protein [Candidatus Rifleibacterium sp.]HPT46457.1 prepilin-type N-terminal cleavage/methylation domain-containing protein [Candidatus Rifleibacterium sp.]
MADNPQKRRGFTLVEAMIGMMLASALITMSYKVFTYINMQRSRGSVDLQELQGARHAINYLRRDFRCAAPVFSNSASLGQIKIAMRNPVVNDKDFNKSGNTVPIVVYENEVHFFRHLYNTPETASKPAVEEVIYQMDGARKCLVRSAAGLEKVFPDIRGARFELYAHPLKPEIPMLLVTLIIDADLKDQGGGRNFFELTTTVSSAVANQNINNPYWNINNY